MKMRLRYTALLLCGLFLFTGKEALAVDMSDAQQAEIESGTNPVIQTQTAAEVSPADEKDVIVLTAASDKYAAYPIAQNSSLQGKLIIVDPGHGVGSGGGVDNLVEHESNLRLAKLLQTNLLNAGATVIMTRETETDVENYARTALANQIALRVLRRDLLAQRALLPQGDALTNVETQTAECLRLEKIMQSIIEDITLADTYFNSPYDDTHTRVIHNDLKKCFEMTGVPLVYENVLYLSIHSNAVDSTSVSGCIQYYLDNEFTDSHNYYTNYTNVARNEQFATFLGTEISAAAEWTNRGNAVNDFFMLREHNLPAALAEIGYMTNASDRAKLLNETYQKRIANALYYAVVSYFEANAAAETTPLNEEIITQSSIYKLAKGTVTGIAPMTAPADLLAGITCPEGYTAALYDSTGAALEREQVVSGDILAIADAQGNVVQGHVAVIYGDVNCDGDIALLDLLRVQKYLLGILELDGTTSVSADITGDDTVTLLDLLRIQKHLLGTAEIAQ